MFSFSSRFFAGIVAFAILAAGAIAGQNDVVKDGLGISGDIDASAPDQQDYLPSGLRGLAGITGDAARMTAAPGDPPSTKSLSAPPSIPGLHALGLVVSPPTKPAAAAQVFEGIQAARRARAAKALKSTEKTTLLASPPAWDNSAGLPPVGDQGAQGSCVSWACGYYYKTYQEGKEHSWDLTDPAHQFSPAFLYNQIQGFDEGSTFEDNLNHLADQGCATLATTPYVDTDYSTWPSAAAYREGIPFRAQSWNYLGHGETPAVFEAVKAILSSGDLCVVGFPVYRPNAASPGRFDQLAATDYEYDLHSATDNYQAGYYAIVIAC